MKIALATTVIILTLCCRRLEAQTNIVYVGETGPATWSLTYGVDTNVAMQGHAAYSIDGMWRTNTYAIHAQYSLQWTNEGQPFSNFVRFLIRTEVEVERKEPPPEPKWERVMVPASARTFFPPPLPSNR